MASPSQSQPLPSPPASQAPDTGADPATDAATIAVLAGVLAGGLGAAATLGLVSSVLAAAGIASVVGSTNVASEALRLASKAPIPKLPARAGPAAQRAARTAWSYRAAYVLSAARRLAQGALPAGDFGKAVGQERLYAAAHHEAAARRLAAARTADALAARYGDELGWYARHDTKTTAECRAASGHNFSAATGTAIGYPGAGPHVNCRCRAGPPHRGATTVNEALARAELP